MTRIIAAIAFLLLTGLSGARAWPDRPIHMVVGYAAGGTTDVMARLVAERLAGRLRQPGGAPRTAGDRGESARRQRQYRRDLRRQVRRRRRHDPDGHPRAGGDEPVH